MHSIPFKLGSFSAAGRSAFAGLVLGDDRVLDIGAAARLLALPLQLEPGLAWPRTLDDLLGHWERNFDSLCNLTRLVHEQGWHETPGIALPIETLRVMPPVARPGKMVCHAQNYADHIAEMRRSQFGDADVDLSKDFMGEKSKTWPYAFLKASSALAGAYDDIVLAQGHAQIDWEAEMALVLGTTGKRLTEANALSHVAGFMTFNDVSCRDNQWRPDRPTLRSDWFAAKSFDTFAPAGPFMVPRQFITNHLDLRIKLSVNGKTMQDGTTAGLIFTPEEQLAFFSQSMTWHAGDILVTGTPAGTGQGLGIFLAEGDVVETEVEGLGKQRNRCVADR